MLVGVLVAHDKASPFVIGYGYCAYPSRIKKECLVSCHIIAGLRVEYKAQIEQCVVFGGFKSAFFLVQQIN